MWRGTYSVGSATSPSGNSGKSLSTSAISPRVYVHNGVVPADLPPTVLVVSETAGFHHDSIPAQQEFLRSVRGLRVVVLDRVAQLTPARLRGAGAVVFASTSGSPRFSATGRRALLRFVRGGGGVVGIPSASDTFADWPGYVRLVGASFAGHAPLGPGRVDVIDRRSPITGP